MNTFEFTYLLNKPNAIKDKHTIGLEAIVNEFPYFQSARALLLKGLYNQESFQYNPALRKTAAYTTDRSVLFDFITSGNFAPVQKLFIDEKEAFINEIKVNDLQIVTVISEILEPKIESSTLEQSIVKSIEESEIVESLPNTQENIATISEKLNQDHSYLMTETLAKVYLEQRKYQKAIQAYEILILKYPEKSTFFADRISDIRVLQQNNN